MFPMSKLIANRKARLDASKSEAGYLKRGKGKGKPKAKAKAKAKGKSAKVLTNPVGCGGSTPLPCRTQKIGEYTYISTGSVNAHDFESDD